MFGFYVITGSSSPLEKTPLFCIVVCTLKLKGIHKVYSNFWTIWHICWPNAIFIISCAYFTKVISNFPKLAYPKIGYPLWSTPTVLTPFRGQGGSSWEKKNLKSRWKIKSWYQKNMNLALNCHFWLFRPSKECITATSIWIRYASF